MNAVSPITRARMPASAVLWGGLGFVVVVRAALNGGGAATAFGAGAAFGLALVALAARTGLRLQWPPISAVALGLAGGFALVIVPAVVRPGVGPVAGLHPEPFAAWVAVTLLVAVGEEAVLRGVLLDSVRASLGLPGAVIVTSLAFALLHVPLYGWHVVPLDLAVGVLLAGLRVASGGVAAPAIAHALADLATWWL